MAKLVIISFFSDRKTCISFPGTRTGHIYFRILGQSSHKEYDLADHSWHTCEAITLKPEEKQILTLAAQGFTTKEIGEQLFRSENTVKFYRKALFEKLEVTSITEALAFATNYGLI